MTIHAPLDDLAPQPSAAQSAPAPIVPASVPPPPEVSEEKIFGVWHYDDKQKVPDPIPGGQPTSLEGFTAGTYNDAYLFYGKTPGAAGVACALTPLSSGKAVIGIDLDSCRNRKTGEIEPWARAIIALFASYAEVSPSETGAKLFCLVDVAILPAVEDLIARSRKGKTGSRHARKFARGDSKDHGPQIEFYASKRWFTYTGLHIPGTPTEWRTVDYATIAELIEKLGPAFVADDPTKVDASAIPESATSTVPKIERHGAGLDRSLLPIEVQARVADAERRLPSLGKKIDGTFSNEDPTGSGEKHSFVCTAKLAGLSREDAKILTDHHPAWAESTEKEGDRGFERCWEKAPSPPDPVERGAAAVAGINIPPSPHVEAAAEEPFHATPLDDADDTPLEPRRPVYGTSYFREYVSAKFGPGGVGKSTLVAAQALAVATGRDLLAASTSDIRHHVRKSGPVYIMNGEDPRDEMRRRIRALRRHFNIPADTLKGRIYMDSGRDRLLKLAIRDGNRMVVSTIVRGLIAELKRLGIILLVIDPLVSFHEAGENDNGEMDYFMRVLSQIAHEARVAIVVVHHTKKGAVAGDADSSRGASAIKDAVRSAQSLSSMTAKEAEVLQIPEGDRKKYVRLDDAKNNLAPQVDKAEWFVLSGIALNNGDAETPEGDFVQTITRWVPPAHVPLGAETTRDLLGQIDAGPGDGEKYAFGRQAKAWVGHLVMEVLGIPESAARVHIERWRQSEVLREVEYSSSSRHRKIVKGISVDWENAPAAPEPDEDGEG